MSFLQQRPIRDILGEQVDEGGRNQDGDPPAQEETQEHDQVEVGCFHEHLDLEPIRKMEK